MRETVNDKALRLINTGKVKVRHYDDTTIKGGVFIYADVDGDNGTYPVIVEVGNDAECGCPATTTCSHILAVLAEALYVETGLPATVSLGDRDSYASLHPDLGDGT